MTAVAPAFAGDLQSPEAIKTGLYKLASEYGDMERKLDSERYDRLPHENEEFQEESAILRAAVANESAAFREQVATALQSALTASGHVAEVSATHDRKQVTAALGNLAAVLRSLNALFPATLRSEPGSVVKAHPASAPASS
jgi:hypothetical protein